MIYAVAGFQDVRELQRMAKDDATFSVTFSAGAVAIATDDRLDAATERADKLLYAAKEAGRNRVLAAAA